jgi:CO dehydrogenase maturation factor
VDDVDVLVLVAEATSVGLTSAGRIAQLASALPVRVKHRVLVLNKVNPSGPGWGLSPGVSFPEVDAVVHVPFDEDVYRRCVRGEPVDESAGKAARPAVEQLAGLCLSLPQLPAKTSN